MKDLLIGSCAAWTMIIGPIIVLPCLYKCTQALVTISAKNDTTATKPEVTPGGVVPPPLEAPVQQAP